MEKPSPAINIFDYCNEDDFLTQTREKKPSKAKIAPPQQQPRSLSAATNVLPLPHFKESVYVKKTSQNQNEEKNSDVLKLKTIFENESLPQFPLNDSRSKSHTDLQIFASDNLEKISKQDSYEEKKVETILSTLPKKIRDPYLTLEDSPNMSNSQRNTVNKLVFNEIFGDNDYEKKYKPYYIENSEDLKEVIVDINEKVVCFTLSNKLIAVGTSHSGIHIYDFQTKIKRNLKIELGLLITALDISYDDELLVVAFANGTLNFYEILSLKLLKSFPKIHLSSVLSIKFYHSSGKSLKEARLLSSDVEENVNKILFEKGILNFDVDSKLLINSWGQFFQIEVLHNSSYSEHRKLIALTSTKQVVIVTVEPKPQKLMAFHRPQQINERVLPWISWNDFEIQNKSPQNFLSVLWGNLIFLIKVEESEDGTIKHYISSQLVLENSGFFSCFLNPEHIFIIESCEEKTENGFLISINEFKAVKEENLNESVFINEEIPLSNELLIGKKIILPFNKEISFHTYLKDSNSMLIQCKTLNFLRHSKKNKLFYCKEGEKLIEIGFFSSEKFFEKLLKGKDFNAFFYFILQINQGNTSYLLDEPEKKPEITKKLLSNAICDIFTNMLSQSEENFNKSTSSLMFVTVETQNFEILFSDLQDLYIKNSKEQFFMENLETFIYSGKISYMPDKSMRSIITFFQKNGKFDVIESLILSLDYKKTDICPMITLCLELHLLKALIYVSTVFSDDFMTPLIKIFSLYEEIERKKKLSENQEGNKKEQFEEEKKAINYGEKCLDYLELCFSRKLISKEPLNEEKFGLVLMQLILWVFEPENLQKLIKIDPKSFYQTICHLFRRENLVVLKSNCRSEDIKIKESAENLIEIEKIGKFIILL